ncbi:DUF6879 family protein [Cryptosporangium sp. NPDC051539]|uniref:DUF6879 family protein n=1 Tax=Cryptosporangium sp. NPDC051539 TaxID=3363962 RepID=UPI0037AFB836
MATERSTRAAGSFEALGKRLVAETFTDKDLAWVDGYVAAAVREINEPRARLNADRLARRVPDVPFRSRSAGGMRQMSIAVLAGTVVFGLGAVSGFGVGASPLVSLAIAVVVAGFALLSQMVAGLTTELRALTVQQISHEDGMRSLVAGAFAQINDSARLFGLLEQTAARTDPVTQMVQHAILIKPGDSDIVYEFAQNEISRTSSFLKSLAAGETTYEGEDQDWLIGLTDVARSSIDATTFATIDAGDESSDRGFWKSPLGRRYLTAQQEAISTRGVTIRRVFVVDEADLINSRSLVDIAAAQTRAGVQVRILDFNRIKRFYTDFREFTVFDGSVSRETVVSAGAGAEAPAILNTKLVLDIGQIRKRVADFEYLWSLGEAFDRTPGG